MKFLNIIKLLSVLLCVFALFTACGAAKNDATNETSEQQLAELETEEMSRGPVDPILENFFTFSRTDSWIELGEAKRLDGSCVSMTSENEIIVLRSAEVDTQNIVTETFKVYNTILQKVVLEVKNQYDYDNYTAFNWNNLFVYDESVKYPESVMKVEAIECESIILIKISKATVVPTTKDVLKENEDACFYSISVTSEFYDIAGNKITDAKYNASPYYRSGYSNGNLVCYDIGAVNAFFDIDTMELVKTVNVDNQATISGYDGESAKYGYFFGEHFSAFNSHVQYFELYDKATGTCIYTHYFEPASAVGAFVLKNGNLFIQVHNLINEDTLLPYDYEQYGEKYSLASYIFNVNDKSVTEIECDYVVNDLSQITEQSVKYYEALGIKFTDNVDHIASVAFIHNGKIDKDQIAVIDTNAKVLFALDPIVPEHQVNTYNFGFKILNDNNYLVDLYNIVASRAIVSTDGKIRCYLRANDRIVGDYVVNETGIFDFDMNLIYEFDDEKYSLATTIGDNIIISKTSKSLTESESEPMTDEIYTEYYIFKSVNNGKVYAEPFYDTSDKMVLSSSNNDYLIFYNSGSGKHYLYNANLDHVLTTQNAMSLYRCEDGFIVLTHLTVNGETVNILYTVPSSLAK